MSQLDELVQSSPIPSWRPFAYLIITVLVAAIVWSTLAELEEVATADAAVVPRDQIKVIQHLEGGIIQVIHVREGDIEIVEVAIPRTRTAQREVEERIREVRLTFRREANERLAEVDGEIASTRELLAQASAQQQRAVITSPIGGTVKNLLINTVGGVVQPGQPIMAIVPGGENLIVEAKLNPIDIGFIEVGQPAVVKLTTYDFVRYGGLEGTLIEVAPDSTIEENGDPYFRVRVETEKTYLGDEPGDLPIFAGMVATVDIKTGTKSVAKYLIRPVLKLRYEAFRER